jgi:raffinose/stachyose/melibiose transport system permease protein
MVVTGKKISFGNIVGKMFLALLLFVQLYPIFWILISSVKSTNDFNLSPSYALPKSLHFSNYVTAWTTGKMGIFFKNSAISTIVSLFFIVMLSSMVSFAVTKMQWKFRNTVLKIFLSGIMIPTAVVLIPLFSMYRNMGILNTRFSLIITYIAFGLPLSVFLLSTYLKGMPDELLEAAAIDGAGIFRIFFSIVMPLMKTGIVTVLVIQFFFRWNDLMFAMTFISKTELRTVQTGLLYFSDIFGNRDWGAIFASIAISVVPTLTLYAVLNKMVIEGMTSGAIKG